MSAPNEYAGHAGVGNFTQSGGTNTISGSLYVGYLYAMDWGSGITSSGAYSLSNSGILSAPSEFVGYATTGTFTQTGGTNTISSTSGALWLAYLAGSTGTYNLQGGKLILPELNVGSGTGAFNFGGGTLQANASFTTTADMTFTGSGNATVDTAGYNVVFSGCLSGSGGLTKTDSGTLVLNGTSTYTGGTVVLGGLLDFGAPSATPTSGIITVNHGGGVVLRSYLTLQRIADDSTGALVLLPNNSNEDVNMAGHPSLSLGAAGTVSYYGTLTPASTTYNLGGGWGTLTFNPSITGAYGLNVQGPGTVVIASSANNYSGGTTLSDGELGVTNANALGSGTLTIAGGTLANAGTGAITLANNIPSVWNGDFTFAGTNDLNLGTGSVTLGGSGSRTVTVASNTLTVGGPIGDGGHGYGLTKAGTGTLVLGGANTFTGGVAISAGTLELDNANAAQYSTVTVGVNNGLVFGSGVTAPVLGGLAGAGNVNLATTGSATVSLTVGGSNASTTYTGILSGNGGLTLVGGSLVLSGSNTYTGATTVNGGTLQVGTGGSGEGLATASIVDNAALVFSLSDTLTFTSAISGTGNLTKSGGGALVVSGTNNYSGGTTIAGGALDFSTSSALPGTGTITIYSGGSVVMRPYLSASGWLARSSTASTGALALAVSSSDGISMAGYPNLSLGAYGSTAVTYSGTFTPNDGTYNLGGGGGTLVFALSITGANSLNVFGPGTVVLANSANSFTGGTTLNAGQLNVNNAHAIATGPFTIAGGNIGNTSGAAITLSTNNAQTWNSDFTFAGTNDLNLGTGTVTLGGNRTVTVASNNLTVGGVISGNGYSLTKAGTGTLILAGSNTYTGGTTINAGQLQLNNNNAAKNGPVTVNAANGLTFDPSATAPVLGGLTGTGSVNLVTAGSQSASVNLTVSGSNTNMTFSARSAEAAA